MMPPPPVRPRMTPFPSPPRRSLLIVAAALLAACQGDPPRVCGSIPEQRVFVRQTAELQPCFEDPEGEALTLSAISSDPEVVTVLVDGPKLEIRGVAVGSVTITVTARDPGGLTASIDIKVVVPNRPPLASGTLPAARVALGSVWGAWVDEVFEDPDAQALTFSASSANPAIATAGIVDSVHLAVRGVAAGTTTVTVTATDPGGLTATSDAQVEVRERLLVFRDDFESTASLDDWRTTEGSASVEDGMLWLRGTASREANVTDWELTLAMGFVGDSAYSGQGMSSGGWPSLSHFSIGHFDMSVWDIDEDTNYRMVVWAPGWKTEDGWWGMSDAVADEGELTEVTFGAWNGRLTAMAGSTLLVTVDMRARDWSNELSGLDLFSGALDEKGYPGFFDWVELNALEAGADTDRDAGPRTGLRGFAKAGPGVGIPGMDIWRK